MNPGDLRKRLTIQSRVLTRDSFGQEVVTFLTRDTVWGQVRPLTAREFFQSQQGKAEVTHQITIRHYSGLKPDWRIVYGTRVFDIKSIINTDERNEENILLCTEWIQ